MRIAILLFSVLFAFPCLAQIAEVETGTGPLKYGEARVSRFQAGCEVTASQGACRNIRVMVAVPLECAEQQVTVVEEDFSREVTKVDYRVLDGHSDGGARQMLVIIPQLAAGATARAVVTFEVRTRPILPAEGTARLQLVVPDKPDRDLRQYLTASPYIEARDKRIRTAALDVWKSFDESSEATPAWTRIEALYDHMLDHATHFATAPPIATAAVRCL
jgi:hypothetical protein